MILLYILLVAYILAVNFYAFLFVKSLRDKECGEPISRKTKARKSHKEQSNASAAQAEMQTATPQPQTDTQTNTQTVTQNAPTPAPQPIPMGKLFITGLLGGAITIYACVFIFKWRRSDFLLMVAMPLLGVLNIYLWVLLFRSGFSFLAVR